MARPSKNPAHTLMFGLGVLACFAGAYGFPKGHPGMVNTAAADDFVGTVSEVIDVPQYTYVSVVLSSGDDTIWAAAPKFTVEAGANVRVPRGMLMQNHHSSSLNRTFDRIYFVDAVDVAGEGDERSETTTREAHNRGVNEVAPDFSGLSKPWWGGYRIADLYAGSKKLAGKVVAVRAKVVKANLDIMGTNWIHLRDGTGAPGENDLTVTTSVAPQVGQTVVAKGYLAVDRDFGHGYRFKVIIEQAKLAIEK